MATTTKNVAPLVQRPEGPLSAAPSCALPWTSEEHKALPVIYWHHARIMAGFRLVAEVQMTQGLTGNEAEGARNLAFIVKACNTHQRLVEALRELMDAEGGCPGHTLEQRAAWNKAVDVLRECGVAS